MTAPLTLSPAHQREVKVAAGRHIDTAIEHLMQADECLALLGIDPELRLRLLKARKVAGGVGGQLTADATARPALVVERGTASWKAAPLKRMQHVG